MRHPADLRLLAFPCVSSVTQGPVTQCAEEIRGFPPGPTSQEERHPFWEEVLGVAAVWSQLSLQPGAVTAFSSTAHRLLSHGLPRGCASIVACLKCGMQGVLCSS